MKKVYFGKPQNQRDPNAVLAQFSGNMQQQQPLPNQPATFVAPTVSHGPGALSVQPQANRPGSKKRFSVKTTLNAPTRLQTTEDVKHVVITNDDPGKDSVFARGTSSREKRLRRTMEPSTPALIEISHNMLREMIADDSNIQKTITPEFLDYYSTAMLWFRIIGLKYNLSMPLTDTERELYLILEQLTFAVPAPILMQLKVLGRIQTTMREHLIPVFPELPTYAIAGHGGYYGVLSADTHNLYEEIPCLGVLSEAVRQAVSNAQPGPYQSSLQQADLVPNGNLLGYYNLLTRRNEAKNIAFAAGITAAEFPEHPHNTGVNLDFLTSISSVLSNNKTFKTQNVNFITLANSGSLIQAMSQVPMMNEHQLEKLCDIESRAISQETDSMNGCAVTFIPQLLKEKATRPTAHLWACVNNPPQTWIDNRNIRRSLPAYYLEDTFISPTQPAKDYRQSVMQQLVLTRR